MNFINYIKSVLKGIDKKIDDYVLQIDEWSMRPFFKFSIWLDFMLAKLSIYFEVLQYIIKHRRELFEIWKDILIKSCKDFYLFLKEELKPESLKKWDTFLLNLFSRKNVVMYYTFYMIPRFFQELIYLIGKYRAFPLAWAYYSPPIWTKRIFSLGEVFYFLKDCFWALIYSFSRWGIFMTTHSPWVTILVACVIYDSKVWLYFDQCLDNLHFYSFEDILYFLQNLPGDIKTAIVFEYKYITITLPKKWQLFLYNIADQWQLFLKQIPIWKNIIYNLIYEHYDNASYQSYLICHDVYVELINGLCYLREVWFVIRDELFFRQAQFPGRADFYDIGYFDPPQSLDCKLELLSLDEKLSTQNPPESKPADNSTLKQMRFWGWVGAITVIGTILLVGCCFNK